MLQLRTFGGLSIESGRVDARAASRRRPLALLALLAIAGPRGLRREKVASLLWPESDEARSHNSLNQALSEFRRHATTDDLVVGTTELRLNADAVSSDVDEFEQCIASGDLERAAALYQGPFLDGFFVKGAVEFERWVEEHRRRLHQMYSVVLQKLARQAEARGDHADAIAWWRRLATLEPASAAAAVGLMKALVATGERAAALQYYRVHQAVLHQEFGVEAEEVVTAFAARLRLENGTRVAPASATPNDGLLSFESHAAPDTLPPASGTDREDPSAVGHPHDAAVNAPRAQATPGRGLRWSVFVTAAGLAAIALIAFRETDRHPQYNIRQVVVTGFVNRTGDSTLDAFGFLAADYITDALQRSGLVEVTDPVTSLGAVTGVRDAAVAKDEGKEMRLVAEATRAGLVVSGRYSREGDSIAIVARVSDAVQGKLIAATEVVLGSAGAPGDALDRVRRRVLGILAVRLDDRLADVLPPNSTSPPTLPAYREYVDGLLEFQRSALSAALPHLQRAYELDSTFVAPLVWQAFVFWNTGHDSAQQSAIQELARHGARLSPLDRHALAFFEAIIRSDLPAQIASARQASDLTPGSIWSYKLGAGLLKSGRPDDAVAAFAQIDRRYGWLRNWPPFWFNFIHALHEYGDHRRELDVAREARRALPPQDWPAYSEAQALAALGRRAELRRVVAEMQASPDSSQALGFLLLGIGKELRSRGDTSYARQLLDSAVAWYRALPPAEAQRSRPLRQFAVLLYEADHWDEARPLFQRFRTENPRDWWALMYVGLCFAHQGERGAAEEIISGLLAAGDSAQWFEGWAPVGNVLAAARIAAALGDRERTVRLLKELKDRGQRLASRHALSKLSKDFHALIGYAPYMALTEPEH